MIKVYLDEMEGYEIDVIQEEVLNSPNHKNMKNTTFDFEYCNIQIYYGNMAYYHFCCNLQILNCNDNLFDDYTLAVVTYLLGE